MYIKMRKLQKSIFSFEFHLQQVFKLKSENEPEVRLGNERIYVINKAKL